MKKSYNWFLGLLAVTILNSAFFGFVTVPFLFGGGRIDVWAMLLYLPNAIISILIILLSLRAKKRANGGALWIPMTCSLAVVIFESLLIWEVAIPRNISSITIVIEMIIVFLVIYSLFRYYFSLYRKIRSSGM